MLWIFWYPHKTSYCSLKYAQNSDFNILQWQLIPQINYTSHEIADFTSLIIHYFRISNSPIHSVSYLCYLEEAFLYSCSKFSNFLHFCNRNIEYWLLIFKTVFQIRIYHKMNNIQWHDQSKLTA